ncbi:hypothetical protein [Methylomonas paludis]|nr:hypothetical protein [Methylomonas paludis]
MTDHSKKLNRNSTAELLVFTGWLVNKSSTRLPFPYTGNRQGLE